MIRVAARKDDSWWNRSVVIKEERCKIGRLIVSLSLTFKPDDWLLSHAMGKELRKEWRKN
jgi:hypothetical protein